MNRPALHWQQRLQAPLMHRQWEGGNVQTTAARLNIDLTIGHKEHQRRVRR